MVWKFWKQTGIFSFSFGWPDRPEPLAGCQMGFGAELGRNNREGEFCTSVGTTMAPHTKNKQNPKFINTPTFVL